MTATATSAALATPAAAAAAPEPPRITLVTPCLNHVEFIDAAMRSVLTQGYPNLEYVVLDAGSTDGSRDAIRNAAGELAYWESAPDGGPYHAVQRGFEMTSGAIMGWLNADDMLHRGALGAVAEIFQAFPEVQWISGPPTQFDVRGRAFLAGPPPRWSRARLLRSDYRWIQQESTFWRRSLWERAGGRLDLSRRLAADLELWVRFSRHARLYGTNALLGGYRVVRGQRSEARLREYLAEADALVACEPRSLDDRRRLASIARVERLQRLPWIGAARRLAAQRDRLHDFAPRVIYDARAGRWVLEAS